MKRFVGISLILLVLVSSLRDLVVFATFKVNQSYIANNLCVNRDEEIPMCRGRCFLQNEIVEEHNDEQRGIFAPNIQNRVELIYLVTELWDTSSVPDSELHSATLTGEPLLIPNNYHQEVFRPPIS